MDSTKPVAEPGCWSPPQSFQPNVIEGRGKHNEESFTEIVPNEASSCSHSRPKAPQGGLNPNRVVVELDTVRTKSLRRLPHIEMFKWNSILDQVGAESEATAPKRDRMRLARYYQSLLDSGKARTRPELARRLRI